MTVVALPALERSALFAVAATPAVDASMMLSALAMMSSTPFMSAQDCIDTYLAVLPQLVNMRTIYVSQLTPDTAYVIGVQDHGGCAIPADGSLPVEETFCQYVRASGAPVIVTDSTHDVRVASVMMREMFGVKAYVGVPILFSDGSFYGTLCAVDPEPRQFQQIHVDVLRVAARHIGQMIERDGVDRSRTDALHTVEVQQDALDQQTTLLRVVAHDLRTPLSSICGFADLLTMPTFGALAEQQQTMVEHIRRAGKFMNRLVTDLVDVAAAEAQTLMLITEECDAHAIGAEVIAEMEQHAAGQGLTLRLEASPGATPFVGDGDRVEQVLFNLLSNALRYTQRGSVTLRIVPQPDAMLFEVEDTGPGIPADQIDQIWERHVRASGVGKGLGLGLYVVRSLAEAMGGTVQVRSEVGVGSTFGVRLPLHGPKPQKIHL